MCTAVQEQDYIRQEARTLFRQNQSLQDPEEIEAKARTHML
jgi:cell division protein FtsB